MSLLSHRCVTSTGLEMIDPPELVCVNHVMIWSHDNLYGYGLSALNMVNSTRLKAVREKALPSLYCCCITAYVVVSLLVSLAVCIHNSNMEAKGYTYMVVTQLIT